MAGRHLGATEVRRLGEASDPDRPLGLCHFTDGSDAPSWRAVAFVIRVRPGGFMFICDVEDRVAEVLAAAAASPDGAEAMLYKTAEVEVETVRRRAAGSKEIFLVDAPWGALPYFRKSGRGNFELLAIRKDSQVVRPTRRAAMELADRWIAEVVDDPALGEYVTATSQLPSGRQTPDNEDEAEEAAEPGAPDGEGGQADVISQLQARILELEAQQNRGRLAKAQTAGPLEGAPSTRGPRSLFDGLQTGSPELTAQDWKRLQEMAGPQPHRLAQHENHPRAAATQAANDELAEVELEALAPEALPSDPGQAAMIRFLATQTQVLAQLAASRAPPSDPIAHALQGSSGSGSEAGSSVTGARGVAARDAYLRVLTKKKEFSQAVAARAQAELGLASQPPGMMRQFMERKVPIRELKTLTLMGFFFAHMWEDARTQEDELAEFWSARGLVMVEQWAIDNGRSQMAWLLGGLPDPDTSLLQHRRSDLRPYARLCQSTWIAAQVAYLRDIEFLEGRMKAGQRGGTAQTTTEEAEDLTAPTVPGRPRRLPRKPKGGQEDSK